MRLTDCCTCCKNANSAIFSQFWSNDFNIDTTKLRWKRFSHKCIFCSYVMYVRWQTIGYVAKCVYHGLLFVVFFRWRLAWPISFLLLSSLFNHVLVSHFRQKARIKDQRRDHDEWKWSRGNARSTWTRRESPVRNTNARDTWCGGTCRNRAIDTTTTRRYWW